jgi:hypothetical protein
MTRTLLVLAVVLVTASGARAEGLVWNLEPVKTDRLGPTSVSWEDARGKVVWTRALPEPLRFSVCCRADPKTRAWLDKARAGNYAMYWTVMRIGDGVLISDAGEVLVLDVRDGKVLFEWTDTRERYLRGGFDSAMIDQGTVTVTIGGITCSQAVAGQSFVVPCAGQLVYFGDGMLVQLATRPYAKVAEVSARGPKLEELAGGCPGEKKTDVDRTVTVGTAKVRFLGRRLTFCQT